MSRILLCLLMLTACSEAPESELAPWQVAARAGEEAYRTRQYDQAQEQFRQALRLAESADEHEGRLQALEGLAASLAVAGQLDQADSLYSVLLERQQSRLAADSLSGMVVVRTLGALGEINLGRGNVARAEAFFTQILDLDRSGAIDLLPEEPALAYVLQGLGHIRAARGDSAAADSLQGRAAGLRMYGQGFALYVGDDLQQAEDVWRQALAQQQEALGLHPDIAHTAEALGRLLALRGMFDDAITSYRQAAAVYAAVGAPPRRLAVVLEDLAALIRAQDPTEADSLLLQARRLQQTSN